MKKVLVLKAPGTNCDQEMVHALKMAGAGPKALYFFEILKAPSLLRQFDMVVFPGGFSYGDYLGSGKVWSLLIESELKHEFEDYVKSGRRVLGVCNGFQVLVKMGLLPGFLNSQPSVSLTANLSGRFECRWLPLAFEKNSVLYKNLSPISYHLSPLFELPIAHGEGRFVTASPAVRRRLWKEKLVFLRYAQENPNGSVDSIAGITNPQGNVIGLMPHPERFVSAWQHYNWQGAKFVMPWGLEFLKNILRFN